jgi:hypothetical protein
MVSTYAVNVALNGRHLFRTEPQNLADFKKTIQHLKKAFDKKAGFDLSVHREEARTTICTVDEFF